MEVDHERAWLAMKEVVLSKRSHGQDGLLREMTRIEIECRIPEHDPNHPAANGHTAKPALA